MVFHFKILKIDYIVVKYFNFNINFLYIFLLLLGMVMELMYTDLDNVIFGEKCGLKLTLAHKINLFI